MVTNLVAGLLFYDKEVLMKRAKNAKDIVIATSFIILFFALLACTPKVKIRASDTMSNNNSMNKIAVLAQGEVNWPRMGGKSLLILPHCEKATEDFLLHTTGVLSKKGYEIVYAEPVGVGYYSKDCWFLTEDPELTDYEPDFKQIADSDPIFVYPQFQGNGEFERCVHRLIEQLTLAMKEQRQYTFTPAQNDIDVIQEFTGADTICLLDVHGTKYSTARKVGGAFAEVLHFLTDGDFRSDIGGAVGDHFSLLLVFIDAKTGEVLWQRWTGAGGDPLNSNEEFFESALEFFPSRNEPIDHTVCTKEEGFVYCKPD